MTDTKNSRIERWRAAIQQSTLAFDVDGTSIAETLERDLADLSRDLSFIFDESYAAETRTDLTIDILKKWHFADHVPSLISLCAFTLDRLDVPADHDIPVLMASLLGEINNDLPYHGNLHYKKVILQLIRLIVSHNKIFATTNRILDSQQIVLLLCAECIHDLDHDGLGNTVRGVFKQSRLEHHSFDLAKDHLAMAGLDAKSLQAIKTMVLCTDVTPIGDPASPNRQMKAAYALHYHPGAFKTVALNLSKDLACLEDDPALVQMCLLLHEADIATSAGLNYHMTQWETILYRMELNKQDACPQHIVDFLDHTCQRRFFSDAGKRLYSANIARIYALAEDAVKSGNAIFPNPEDIEFMLASDPPPSSDDVLKTVN